MVPALEYGPDRSRTCDLALRRGALYPSELRGHRTSPNPVRILGHRGVPRPGRVRMAADPAGDPSLVLRAIVLLALVGFALPGAASTFPFDLAVAELADAQPADVANGVHDAAFRAAEGPMLTADRQARRWYRVTPASAWHDAEAPLLVAYAPYGNVVTVLAPPGYVPRRAAIRDRGLDPRWTRHALVFDLPPGLSPGTPVYVALEPGRRFPARLAIETHAAFGASETAYARGMTAILTAIAVMCLVIGAFALALRERTLGFLGAALVLQLVYLLLITGEGYAMPGLRALSDFGFVPVWVTRAFGAAALLVFVRRFVGVDAFAPRTARALGVAAWAFVALALAALLPFLRPYIATIGNVLLFGSSALAVAAGAMGLRHGVRAAWFFLPAWLPMLALDMLREAQLLGLANVYPGNEYAQPGAVALAALLFSAGMADRLLAVRIERDLARDQAERDPLTGTLNRRAITARIEAACARLPPDGALALLFVDLDHFKRINDRYGHAAGDACLRAVVAIVDEELRGHDALGRYGGEEFVVLLDGASVSHARAVGERIRAKIEVRCATVEGNPVGLTASLGVADTTAGRSAAALIAAADRAMYAAKKSGRNAIRDLRDVDLRVVAR
jgi:diguanylate cyclase (GGDEF)-like protein